MQKFHISSSWISLLFLSRLFLGNLGKAKRFLFLFLNYFMPAWFSLLLKAINHLLCIVVFLHGINQLSLFFFCCCLQLKGARHFQSDSYSMCLEHGLGYQTANTQYCCPELIILLFPSILVFSPWIHNFYKLLKVVFKLLSFGLKLHTGKVHFP